MVKLYPPIPDEKYIKTSIRIVTRNIYLQRSFKGKEKTIRRNNTPNINVITVIR